MAARKTYHLPQETGQGAECRPSENHQESVITVRRHAGLVLGENPTDRRCCSTFPIEPTASRRMTAEGGRGVNRQDRSDIVDVTTPAKRLPCRTGARPTRDKAHMGMGVIGHQPLDIVCRESAGGRRRSTIEAIENGRRRSWLAASHGMIGSEGAHGERRTRSGPMAGKHFGAAAKKAVTRVGARPQ